MSPGDSTVLFRTIPAQFKIDRQDRKCLRAFAVALSASLASSRPFTCLVTSDRALRRLNRDFRGLDYATDVLSFPAEDSHEDPQPLGDLAISVERAAVQAAEFGHSCLDELRVLMLHGVLHLLGYDHESDRGQMARAERKWRIHFDLPANLIARTRGGLAS
jgi:probable rRNA maturation factor